MLERACGFKSLLRHTEFPPEADPSFGGQLPLCPLISIINSLTYCLLLYVYNKTRISRTLDVSATTCRCSRGTQNRACFKRTTHANTCSSALAPPPAIFIAERTTKRFKRNRSKYTPRHSKRPLTHYPCWGHGRSGPQYDRPGI